MVLIKIPEREIGFKIKLMGETGLVFGALVTSTDLSDFPWEEMKEGGSATPRHVYCVRKLVAGGDGAHTRVFSHEQKIQSNVVTNSSVTHLMDEHLEFSRTISIIMELWMMEEDGEQDNDQSGALLTKQIFMKYSLCDQPELRLRECSHNNCHFDHDKM